MREIGWLFNGCLSLLALGLLAVVVAVVVSVFSGDDGPDPYDEHGCSALRGLTQRDDMLNSERFDAAEEYQENCE